MNDTYNIFIKAIKILLVIFILFFTTVIFQACCEEEPTSATPAEEDLVARFKLKTLGSIPYPL
jgi:hypothetical protein